jgi:ABC-2 type transport system permease protein
MSATDTIRIGEEREPAFGFWRRSYAMLVKEFIQLRRDRVSFAMIIIIPVMQLLLFGYAINTTPRHLPTAVLLQEDTDLGRSILKAMENTAYFRFTREVHTVEQLDELLQSGKVLFGVEIPRGFERAVRRGDKPALLVAADATDPVAGRWCRARWHTTCTSVIRPKCRSRSAPMPATIRRRNRASTSCPAWSGPFSP